MTLADRTADLLREFGLEPGFLGGSGKEMPCHSPIDGSALPTRRQPHRRWRWPRPSQLRPRRSSCGAPRRPRCAAALVKRFGELLREHKEALADLVGLEAGKVRSRPSARCRRWSTSATSRSACRASCTGARAVRAPGGTGSPEMWHPLGVVGVISAFNFPVAVWAWNSAVALVCGDPVVWKPSESTSLTALAANALLARAIAEPARRAPRPGGAGRTRRRRGAGGHPGSPWSAPPVRPGWAARSARGSRPGSDAACSSSAATTPSSSPRPPISTSP